MATYEFVKGDLFSAPPNYILAHCVSADFKLGAGIAKRFNEYGVRDELMESGYLNCWQGFGYSIHTSMGTSKDKHPLGVYNLVTKEKYYEKPDNLTVFEALCNMREELCKMRDQEWFIAMPRIGCGLDKLDWNETFLDIQSVFDGYKFNIAIYSL